MKLLLQCGKISAALLLIAAISGCGSESKKPIGGSVSFEAEPVKKGTIILVPGEKGLPQAVASIVDGKYSVPAKGGVLPGTYSVRITAYKQTGKNGNTGPLDGNRNVPILRQYIPSEFNSKTQLSVTIVEDQETYNFELTKN